MSTQIRKCPLFGQRDMLAKGALHFSYTVDMPPMLGPLFPVGGTPLPFILPLNWYTKTRFDDDANVAALANHWAPNVQMTALNSVQLINSLSPLSLYNNNNNSSLWVFRVIPKKKFRFKVKYRLLSILSRHQKRFDIYCYKLLLLFASPVDEKEFGSYSLRNLVKKPVC